MSKKEIATKKNSLPVNIQDMLLEDSGLGQENMSKEDFAIPRISILQSNSPQATKRTPEYLEGAEPSMIIENVSNQLFSGEDGLIIVPIAYRRTIIEWKLRTSSGGGGFVADHGLNLDLINNAKRDQDGRLINDDGNQLVETAEYYVFMISDGDWQPAVLSMSSTQMRKSKRWNTLINSVKIDSPNGGRMTPAMFYMAYHFTTLPESNDKGSWFGWSINKHSSVFDLENGSDIYLAAREFKKQIDAGDVKVSDHSDIDTSDDDSPM